MLIETALWVDNKYWSFSIPRKRVRDWGGGVGEGLVEGGTSQKLITEG